MGYIALVANGTLPLTVQECSGRVRLSIPHTTKVAPLRLAILSSYCSVTRSPPWLETRSLNHLHQFHRLGRASEVGADLAGDQGDLLRCERLPSDLQRWTQRGGVKYRDAVHQELAQPGQAGDVHAQDRVDVQVGAKAEGLGDLGGLPPQRLQGPVEGPAAVPQMTGGIPEVAAVAFGVDHVHAGGADDQVVEVGGRPGDG